MSDQNKPDLQVLLCDQTATKAGAHLIKTLNGQDDPQVKGNHQIISTQTGLGDMQVILGRWPSANTDPTEEGYPKGVPRFYVVLKDGPQKATVIRPAIHRLPSTFQLYFINFI